MEIGRYVRRHMGEPEKPDCRTFGDFASCSRMSGRLREFTGYVCKDY